MKRYHLMLCGLIAFAVAGCTMVEYREPFSVGVVEQGGQRLLINQIVILTDSSGSMGNVREREKFPIEKSLLETFVSAMPNGQYGAGLVGFGGHSWVAHSLLPFDRGSMAAVANGFPYMGSLTPLHDAINRANAEMRGTSGRTAILIFSDGRPTSEVAAFSAAEDLIARYGDVCIHTVLIGDDPDGAAFMQDLASMTNCGSFASDREVSTPQGMRDLVRRIFFGPCPDSDGDGVCDDQDDCPDTPPGVRVDARGCPEEIPIPPRIPEPGPCPDSDGDGVCDEDDECPDTPRGARVDSRGCWIIGEVLFDYDKSNIRPEFYSLLDDVANVLRQNPDLQVRIDGHTDSIASEQYNQRLSERRAQAVYDYLVGRGISPNRLGIRGFGELRPVAPNTTPEGRQLNRRTEFTVIGGSGG